MVDSCFQLISNLYLHTLKPRVTEKCSSIRGLTINGCTLVSVTAKYRKHERQEIIPVGCVLPACANYTCFTTRCQKWWRGPEVNKFEQISSHSHQMWLAEGQGGQGWGILMSHVQKEGELGWVKGPMCGGRGLGGTCILKSNASWVTVIWDPPRGQTDTLKFNS